MEMPKRIRPFFFSFSILLWLVRYVGRFHHSPAKGIMTAISQCQTASDQQPGLCIKKHRNYIHIPKCRTRNGQTADNKKKKPDDGITGWISIFFFSSPRSKMVAQNDLHNDRRERCLWRLNIYYDRHLLAGSTQRALCSKPLKQKENISSSQPVSFFFFPNLSDHTRTPWLM